MIYDIIYKQRKIINHIIYEEYDFSKGVSFVWCWVILKAKFVFIRKLKKQNTDSWEASVFQFLKVCDNLLKISLKDKRTAGKKEKNYK